MSDPWDAPIADAVREWLISEGFSVVRETTSPHFGDWIVEFRSSPVRVVLLRDRGSWSIELGGRGADATIMDAWKAFLESQPVEIGADELDWQFRLLKDHIGEIRLALARNNAKATAEGLKNILRERDRLATGPLPASPFHLTASPRPGVTIDFSIRRWPSGAGLVFPSIVVANESSQPFTIEAADFEFLADGRPVKQHTTPSHELPSPIQPGETIRIERGLHWVDERPAENVGLSYAASDVESHGFKAGEQWDLT